MSSHHRSHVTVAALALFLGASSVACAGSHGESKAPQNAGAGEPATPGGRSASASPAASPAGTTAASPASSPQKPVANGAPTPSSAEGPPRAIGDDEEKDDAELVVNREVVGRCPKLRLVRQHVAEFDPEMVWLAVLESLGECMGEGGPMADQTIGVSGDEEHRHVVREVLGSRGVAPTRVIATAPSQGAAECQGGADCSRRVEITIAPSP
jgi:hypothetical protein